jgi:perosamine synthetase
LERAEDIIERRGRVFEGYRQRLDGIPGIGFQPVADWATPAPWLFCITVDARTFGRSRDDLARYLEDAGIETRPFFIPVHRLPPYKGKREAAVLTVTDHLGGVGLNLPTHAGLENDDIDWIADVVRRAHAEA